MPGELADTLLPGGPDEGFSVNDTCDGDCEPWPEEGGKIAVTTGTMGPGPSGEDWDAWDDGEACSVKLAVAVTGRPSVDKPVAVTTYVPGRSVARAWSELATRQSEPAMSVVWGDGLGPEMRRLTGDEGANPLAVKLATPPGEMVEGVTEATAPMHVGLSAAAAQGPAIIPTMASIATIRAIRDASMMLPPLAGLGLRPS